VNAATNVTGTLPVANGGTGASTLTSNNVLLGNGTSALQVVAPSTTGNVLTSNGTTWTSATPATPSPPTTLYAIGTYVTGRPQNTTTYSADNTIAGSSLYSASTLAVRTSGGAWQNPWSASDGVTGATLINTGTWRCLSSAPAGSNYAISGLWVRIS